MDDNTYSHKEASSPRGLKSDRYSEATTIAPKKTPKEKAGWNPFSGDPWPPHSLGQWLLDLVVAETILMSRWHSRCGKGSTIAYIHRPRTSQNMAPFHYHSHSDHCGQSYFPVLLTNEWSPCVGEEGAGKGKQQWGGTGQGCWSLGAGLTQTWGCQTSAMENSRKGIQPLKTGYHLLCTHSQCLHHCPSITKHVHNPSGKQAYHSILRTGEFKSLTQGHTSSEDRMRFGTRPVWL